MNQYDYVKYLSKSAVAFGLVVGYDVLIDEREFNSYALVDGATFALSSFLAELTADLLSSIWAMPEFSVQGMLTKPLLSGIIYMYLFNSFVRPGYQGSKDNNNNFMMAGIAEVIVSYLANPLSGLFGFKHY